MPTIERPDFKLGVDTPTMDQVPPEVRARFEGKEYAAPLAVPHPTAVLAPAATAASGEVAPPIDETPVVDPEIEALAQAAKSQDQERNGTDTTVARTEPSTGAKPADVAPGAQPAEGEKPAEAAPTATDERLNLALRAAADAIGVTETDPAKLPEAIIARRAELATQQVALEKQIQDQADTAALQRITTNADQHLRELLDPVVRADLAKEFGIEAWPDNWWEADAWNDPTAADMLVRRYNQIEGGYKMLPQYENAYNSSIAQGRAQYEADSAKVGALDTKYPLASKDVVNHLRRLGMSAEGLDTIAQITHASALRASGSSASEVESLRTQVAAHEAALKKARDEGKAEGLKGSIDIANGKAIPATTGLGASSETAPGNLDRVNWSMKLFGH